MEHRTGCAGALGRHDAVRVSEIISALSRALDLTEGQPFGHSARSCLIGMRVGEALGLDAQARSDLFYALLLKDAGCSGNAAIAFELFQSDDRAVKRRLRTVDWSRPFDAIAYGMQVTAIGKPLPQRLAQLLLMAPHGTAPAKQMFEVRCERGADIARRLHFSDATAEAIASLDEHWDGRGYPAGRRGHDIPLLARIASLAQTAEVFHDAYGQSAAVDMVRRRSRRWFDPEIARAFLRLAKEPAFWDGLNRDPAPEEIACLEPEDRFMGATAAMLDDIADAFAQIIDAKSPFTYRHSHGVMEAAVGAAATLGLSGPERTDLGRAALVHDIGKLGVPNSILDKPGPLTDEERAVLRLHPAYTMEILGRVEAFSSIVETAGSHHERIDGRGYHRGIPAGELPLVARILVVADVYDALTATRPYRSAMERSDALDLMRGQVGTAFCPVALSALEVYLEASPGESV